MICAEWMLLRHLYCVELGQAILLIVIGCVGLTAPPRPLFTWFPSLTIVSTSIFAISSLLSLDKGIRLRYRSLLLVYIVSRSFVILLTCISICLLIVGFHSGHTTRIVTIPLLILCSIHSVSGVITIVESSSRLYERLQKLGFQIAPTEVFTSLSAAKCLIEKEHLRPLLFLEDVALEDFKDIDQTNPNAVVVGLAPSRFQFDNLNEAFRLLLDGAKLIAIHKGRYYKRKDGLSLGPGPFVEALQFAADVKADVVGKPERNFFLSALETIDDGKIQASDAVMIGDDVRDDALGSIHAGMHAILVKTGKYRSGDETQIPESSRNCVPSFVEAVEMIEKRNFK